jgi:putative chitinase
MTPELFEAATGCTPALAAKWAEPVSAAMDAYDITTTPRVCAFLAQTGTESEGFAYAREIWGPTPAQERYQGRADLGNTHPGDGLRFLGRGLIMITGRDNYELVSTDLGHDFIASPQDLALPKWAALSAAWYWDSKQLNPLADAEEFTQITYRINGGQNAAADRMRRYQLAQATLGCLPEAA